VRSYFLASIAALLVALPGCGGDDVDFFQPVAQDPGFPGTAGDSTAYQSLFSYEPDPSCAPSVPRVLDRKTEIRIFRGNGITMDMTARFVAGLKRYYDYYGVTVFTRHDVIQVPLDHALVLNSPAIADWMRKNTSEDPNCVSGTACEQAMGAAMFYNVKEFFHAYSEPPQNVINVVLLRRVVALEADQSEAEEAWGVAGLGLSQELLNSVSGSDLGTTSLADVLDETNFSPTIFIGVNLVDFVLPTPDMVIAHEFGHAYGLEHVSSDTTNLMYPSVNRCNQSLNLSQLSTIEKATAKYGNSLLATHDDPLAFLSFEDRAAEILDIVRQRVRQQSSNVEANP
jgi:hypothetical protein